MGLALLIVVFKTIAIRHQRLLMCLSHGDAGWSRDRFVSSSSAFERRRQPRHHHPEGAFRSTRASRWPGLVGIRNVSGCNAFRSSCIACSKGRSRWPVGVTSIRAMRRTNEKRLLQIFWRSQRCAVPVTYSRNKNAGQWKAHGHYLARERATEKREKERCRIQPLREEC